MGSTFLAVLLQVVVAARNNSSCGSCGGPVFGMIKQTPCGGSTWFLDLLDADPCSLGFRHGGRHRDGAYRGVPSGLKDLYPSRRAPPPGAPASQGVSFMSGAYEWGWPGSQSHLPRDTRAAKGCPRRRHHAFPRPAFRGKLRIKKKGLSRTTPTHRQSPPERMEELRRQPLDPGDVSILGEFHVHYKCARTL